MGSFFGRGGIVGRVLGASAGVVVPFVGAAVAFSLPGAGCSSSAGLNGNDVDGAFPSSSGGSSNGDDGASGFATGDAGLSLDAGPYTGLHCAASPCAVAIASGGGHACAVLDDGTVRCWGQNASGELGSGALDGGTVTPSLTPKPTVVAGLEGALQVAAGGYGNGPGVSCATVTASAGDASVLPVVTGDAAVQTGLNPSLDAFCWGSNRSGLLGLGLAADGGYGPALSVPPLTLALSGVTQVVLGGFFGCALVSDGGVSCWGDDSAGELGRDLDAGAFDPSPSLVMLPSAATAVATGKNHACALLADRSVACWGASDHGAIGTIADGGMSTPHLVAGLTATQLAAGEVSTCAITMAGGVECWGGNLAGQLGRGDAEAAAIDPMPQPVALPTALTAVQIASAGSSTCALLSDRSVWCWGDNSYGELGTGSSVPAISPTPAQAQGLSNVVQIASGAGGLTACALLDDGTVRCWGANYADQLGVDTSGDAGPDESPHPVPLHVAL